VLIKAVAGGGGKGMRKVEAASDFISALGAAKREAAAAFGDDRVLLETYVTRPRHIEVQVFADNHGGVVHLFERDCSLQRRHQKVIEEAPAPGMSEEARAAVTSAAVRAAQAVGYQGAGTVEFIADASEGLRGDRIFFMEMNTRLQVEHPVTEMITGQDLVEWQLRVASGEPLPLGQDQLTITGCAIEARLYAENPATGFLPSTGRLEHFRLPEDLRPPWRWREGVRVDSAVEQGGEVSNWYDPMVAKLIVHSETREDAAAALAEACRQVEVWPVKTNAAFLARCLSHEDFLTGEVDTSFIPQRQESLIGPGEPSRNAVIAAATAALDAERWKEADQPSPWNPAYPAFGFRLNAPARRQVRVDGDGGAYSVHVLESGGPEHDYRWRFQSGGQAVTASMLGDRVFVDGGEFGLRREGVRLIVFDAGQAFSFGEPDRERGGEAAGDGAVTAPMPGRIVSVEARTGEAVLRGAKLVTLEAMKMEHGLVAPFDGRVTEVNATPGGQVSEGAVLVRLEPVDPLST
jgi:propionyl-CoA carboxylase alpha chain/3-methylcrotonyl-CoA carboxylase alpha subunit